MLLDLCRTKPLEKMEDEKKGNTPLLEMYIIENERSLESLGIHIQNLKNKIEMIKPLDFSKGVSETKSDIVDVSKRPYSVVLMEQRDKLHYLNSKLEDLIKHVDSIV